MNTIEQLSHELDILEPISLAEQAGSLQQQMIYQQLILRMGAV